MKVKRSLHVFLRGGLGNQLFQYSTGLALAQKHKRNLVIRGDLLPTSEDSIGLVSRWPSQLQDFHHSGRLYTKSNQPFGRTNSFGKIMQVMRLSGDYFPSLLNKIGWLAYENTELSSKFLSKRISLINSYAAFKDLAFLNRDKLCRELNDLKAPSKDFVSLASQMESSEAIAVHIRRGDYMALGKIYGDVSLAFLQDAVRELREITDKKVIWLFSDTPSAISGEVMDFLTPEMVVGPKLLPCPLENMILMSKASGLIAANSSFSWWSAFLTKPGTPVVAPYFVRAIVNNFSKDAELDETWRTLIVE